MKTNLTIAAAMIMLASVAEHAPGQARSELEKRARAVRATAAEMNFTKMPWVTDVFDGFRLAKEDKRPVFLYVVTGDPLDDC